MRILHVYYKLYHHATDCPVHFQFQYHLQDWPTPKTPDSDRSEIFQNCPDAFLFIEGRVPRLPFRLVACLVTRFWQINGFKPDNGWLISLPKLRHKLFWFFVNYLVSASAKFPRPEACVAILSPGVEWMELGGSKTATKSPTWPCDPIAKKNRIADRESQFYTEKPILPLSRAFNESFAVRPEKLLENNEYQVYLHCKKTSLNKNHIKNIWNY